MDRNWRVLLIAGVISLCSAQFVFASYSLGDSGDAVKDLQRRLTQAGCLVRADGRFNETTVSAVKKFQKKHNLDVDGVVGPVTYKALTGKTLKSKKHSSARKNKMSPGGRHIKDVSVSKHKPGTSNYGRSEKVCRCAVPFWRHDTQRIRLFRVYPLCI